MRPAAFLGTIGKVSDKRPNATVDRPLPNSYWVVPQRILAGEYPGGIDDDAARARLERLHQAGIDSFVDLTEDGELPPYRHLLPRHTEYLRSAIVDTGVPDNVSQTQELLATILLHLRGGAGSMCTAGPESAAPDSSSVAFWRNRKATARRPSRP